jgi:phosphoribosylformimino-5-aminoimidazole carboxamide ribotide isomerase
MIIIPAIDIINGKCVRLTKGDYAKQKIYNNNPVEVAKTFADLGFTRLHIVDLDGAKAGKMINMAVLEKIATATNMIIDFGGGVKHTRDVKAILNAGASMVSIGSLAVQEPDKLQSWLIQFGTSHFFIGADVLDNRVKINGWLQDGGISIFDFLDKLIKMGVTNIFCTDIAKDGMMGGPATELYKRILHKYPDIQLTASGGVSRLDDVKKLEETGCKGVIIGKAIYENRVTPDELIKLNT